MGCLEGEARPGPVTERPNGPRQPLLSEHGSDPSPVPNLRSAWAALRIGLRVAATEIGKRLAGLVDVAFIHRFWLAANEICLARRHAELQRLRRERDAELRHAWVMSVAEVKARREAAASRLRNTGQDSARKRLALRSRSGPSGSAGSDH